MSAQSAFPFAVLAVGLGAALYQVRDVDIDAAHGDRPAAIVPHGDDADGVRGAAAGAIIPAALRRAAPPEGLRVDIDVIDARLVDGRVIRVDNLDAAGTRRSCRVQPSSVGIECPDGTRLPLLNGMRAAPPLEVHPGVTRLAPVTAIVVDTDGWEWYEHADGARTTSRLQAVVPEDGDGPAVRVITLHEAAGGAGRAVDAALRTGRANLDR
ncbi:MAG: hypothetical protein ACO3UM_13245 [Planctomycetota bacterium]